MIVRIGYTCTLIGALLVAWLWIRRNQQRMQLTRTQRAILGLSAFIGAMIGAKVPFLLERGWDALLDGTVWFADGKTILGGIAGGYVAVEFGKWLADIRVKTGDSFALPVAMAVGMGRIGCFVAGCCFGRISQVPWACRFELAGDPPGVFRHPTQIYEAAFHFLAAIMLFAASRKAWLVGYQLKAYLICYLVFRFFTEWLRPESPILLNLTTYQLACVLLAALLIVLWARDERANAALPSTSGN